MCQVREPSADQNTNKVKSFVACIFYTQGIHPVEKSGPFSLWFYLSPVPAAGTLSRQMAFNLSKHSPALGSCYTSSRSCFSPSLLRAGGTHYQSPQDHCSHSGE